MITVKYEKSMSFPMTEAVARIHRDGPWAIEIHGAGKADRRLEELWRQFGDVLIDPETERIEEDFLHFPAGTDRMDIWHWFDDQHSIGVAYLSGQKGERL